MPANDWGVATASPALPATPGEAADVLGERMMAGLFDLVVLGAAFVGYGALIGAFHRKLVLSSSGGIHTTWTVSVTGWRLVAFLALCLVYYFALEARFGRTVGKRLVGLRVLARDGAPASTRAILIRTVARVVDALPLLYVVGLISMLCGRPRRRLGDRLAGTIVVHG
jgi:uncharacterized RDD family membrane protein YckC